MELSDVQRLPEPEETKIVLLELEPDVLIVTGDHSAPVAMRYHSWHPVPALLWSRCAPTDDVSAFSEAACLHGRLVSRFPATELMPLALAHVRRLGKLGA
jgi:2,3-bisphosphoglycerate-independent phosphoglycerate mutase